MPRKAFVADLQQAIDDARVDGIACVRKGDDDGEFVVTVDPGRNQPHFDLTASITDVSDYPKEHSCFFMASDETPVDIAGRLGDLFDRTSGKTIIQLLELISTTGRPRLRSDDEDVQMNEIDEASDADSLEAGDDSDEDDEADNFYDDAFGTDAVSKAYVAEVPTIQSTPKFRDLIRQDLRRAKAAGFKVGYLGGLMEGEAAYITLSIRIAKLGISDEAMQAWQVKSTEYLTLIIHYPGGYQSVGKLLGFDADQVRRYIDMRIGINTTYKPTLTEAVHAFTKLAKQEEKDQGNAAVEAEPNAINLGFRSAFISGPLNEFLNERLVRLISFRYNGMPWAGAEEFLSANMASCARDGMDVHDGCMLDDTQHAKYPDIVVADHITDAPQTESRSFPLIAMQFLLRHFVRCCEFCLVCFRRLPDGLEAIKPYVCDSDLCLYQFMSLGFGPSIEHEILAQPKVVDLLVSLCYATARSGKLKTFPNGLSLQVPPSVAMGKETAAKTPTKGTYRRATREIIMPSTMAEKTCNTGDWIVVRLESHQVTPLHARVISTQLWPTIQLTDFLPLPAGLYQDSRDGLAANRNVAPYYNDNPPSPPKSSTDTYMSLTFSDKPTSAHFYIYDQNFDSLSDFAKQDSIVNLLELLPSISEMRAYLEKKESSSLARWTDRISPAAIGLLRWIIASSRACIVAINAPEEGSNQRDERVHGMDGWVQFRLAMGAPDKERRFIEQVRAVTERKKLIYPTLFAWHGSVLSNWHSIIREGLHYNTVANGRAFGDGVYHAPLASTSLGYSHGYAGYRGGVNGAWPQSGLHISSVLALNEIVNAPDEFTSRSPHYVVQHVDWIQTRYLFVKATKALDAESRVLVPGFPLNQDPAHIPVGETGTRLTIPAKKPVINRKKRQSAAILGGMKRTKGGTGLKYDPVRLDDDDKYALKAATGLRNDPVCLDDDDDFDDGASVATLAEDLEVLLDETPQEPPQAIMKDGKPLTDFVPGQLDHTDLPQLEMPEYATPAATKRLQKDFKDLIAVQNKTPAHELGWYIDSEIIENMYQWIVELHSFESNLPLASDMKARGLTSIVLEIRFGKEYPMSPPFVRVVKPRFLSFAQGGGGHVTAGGALCMELLTNNGWSAVSSIESILLQVRLAMSSKDPPARLEHGPPRSYGVAEAVEAFIRACNVHGWTVPSGFKEMVYGGQKLPPHEY